MKILYFLLTLLCLNSALASELDSVVEGVVDMRDVAISYKIPVTYLKSLKVQNTSALLTKSECAELSQHILGAHYLSKAINNQGYPLSSDLPVFKLLTNNYGAFKTYLANGKPFILSGELDVFFKENGYVCSL